jgi:transposase
VIHWVEEEHQMAVKVIGLDTAKNVFQVHGADASGRAVLRKRLRRGQIPDFFANLPKYVVGIEATQRAHYWSRVIGAFGHEIRLVAPQFVKPYLKGQKNDARDAAAICEAISRPEMHFVPRKSIEQQDLQALHRIRSRLVGSRTQLGNQIRGLLAEYGIVLPLHLNQVRQKLPLIFSEDHPLLTSFSRELFASLYEELCTLDERIQAWRQRFRGCSQPMIDASRLPRSKGLGQLRRPRSWQQSRMRLCFAMGDS